MKRYIFILVMSFAIIFTSWINPNTSYAESTFTDLDESHWSYSDISKLVCDGIMNGYPDGTFKPNNLITEAEYLKMAVMASGNFYQTSNYILRKKTI